MKKYILIILGILSILYGFMILGVGSGTKFWLIWELLGGFFFLWAFLVYKKFFVLYKKLGLMFHAIIAAGFTTIMILCGMIATGFYNKGSDDLNYIIVLGAQVREVLQYRLDAAIEYLQENEDTICIVSGGQGVNEPFPEAKGMADYLIKRGIDSKRILLEDLSGNTVENIKYSKELLDESYENVGIVTNNFHVFRAVQIAKAQKLKGVCGIAAYSNIYYLPNNVLRECLGIMKDWMFGNFRT